MATAIPEQLDLEQIRQRLRDDSLYWAESFAKIVTKQGKLVPLAPKDGQRELSRRLDAQRKAGKPQRLIALKARQIGCSTISQAKLIHLCTQRSHYDALTVAHDRETGAKLFRMSQTIYANLPDDSEIKPELGEYRRRTFLHFAGDGDWKQGESFPDSRYLVDTAGEFEAGRGGTYRALHLSEIAFWPQIIQKLTALMQGVPDDPETLVILESTANGYNEFRDLWELAESGESEFEAFFWPWWKETEYTLPFVSETERGEFKIGDTASAYAEREPALVQEHGLTLEQLHWRRWTIANKCGGDIRVFDQEYPTTPDDAFISTGRKAFDPYRIAQLLVRVELTDPKKPREDNPGPVIGDFKATHYETQIDRGGNAIEVPSEALWTPRQRGIADPTAPFRLWLEPDDQGNLLRPNDYIIGVDVSGGRVEPSRDSDYHAIEVVDHRTREQVAEYRSRIEPEQLAPIVLLCALYFNNAWVAIERTGSHGIPVLRILYRDFHYPFVYRPKRTGTTAEKVDKRIGWDTTTRTKPEMIAGMAELLRTGEDGIKSRRLAGELRTLTRDENGSVDAEPGRFDDLAMAYMIAQQVARERPLPEGEDSPEEAGFVVPHSSVGDYDPRYA